MKPKIAIIGATSGIGRELVRRMHARGFIVGATGRRMERLRELQVELETNIHIEYMDVTELQNAMDQLDQLIIKMGGAGPYCTECRRF
ncbi:MAG: SDR family NAD(P)-dependent oxidoreductase, partial [Balneolaceae bacterium]